MKSGLSISCCGKFSVMKDGIVYRMNDVRDGNRVPVKDLEPFPSNGLRPAEAFVSGSTNSSHCSGY